MTAPQQPASAIERYYQEGPASEWERLERHRTEYAVTLRELDAWLPPAPAAILDIGGGPGRYALDLTARGYRVTLLDLAGANLDWARRVAEERGLALHRVIQGNALDLSALPACDAMRPAEGYDAALLMGPLYHLLSEADRARAVAQAWATLRPGGRIFAAFCARYAAVRDLATRSPLTLLERRAEWEATARTGVYHAGQGVGFTDAYFADPNEIEPLMAGAGFTRLDLLGCEGVVVRNEEAVNALTGAAWEAWVEVNYRAGHEPSLYGASDHLLYVGQKPALGRIATLA